MRHIGTLIIFCLTLSCAAASAATDPLASWNDGPSKQAIVAFVKKVTTEGSPDFVKPAERIATFDNDGTLWAEQPVYFQLIFAVDRAKAMAREGGHPEWKDTEPFKSAIAGDMKGLMATGKEGLMKIVGVAHANMTADEFAQSVRDWLATAKHPKTGMAYNKMIYQPMLELLDYLRASGFKTFIVSGGGIDFMRVFAEEAYGIPPEQVIGSSIGAKYEVRDGVKKLPTPNTASPDTVRAMSLDMFFDFLSVRLNRTKAADAKATINLDFGDAGKYVLEQENGVLNHTDNAQSDKADVTVTVSRDTFNKIVLHEVKIADAVKAGDVKITGDKAKLDQLVDNLDTFEFWFNIVTP